VRADVRVPRSAEEAAAVHDVPLGGHPVALAHVGHQLSGLHDVAGELVADDERRVAAALRPVVPFVDVDVGTAHPRAPHADEHLVVPNAGDRDVLHHEAGPRGGLDQRLHALLAPLTWVSLGGHPDAESWPEI
jgi:hypothetical protein